MLVFKPFKGVRAHKDYVNKFPIRQFEDGIVPKGLTKKEMQNAYIQMIKPYAFSKSKDVERNMRKVRANFEKYLEDQKLVQDDSAYYHYVQIFPNKEKFRGLLGLASVEDYLNGNIKEHESTLTARKERFAHYLDKVRLQATPVLLAYQANTKLEMMMNLEERNIPIINFKDEDGMQHKVWRIDNRLKIQQLKEIFENIDAFYIADGHHRIAATSINSIRQKETSKKQRGNEPYNYILSFIVSNQSIKIHDYNRLVKDLNGLSTEDFLKKLEGYFQIHEKGTIPYFPSMKFHISLYLDGKFYSLHTKYNIRSINPVLDDIDGYILEKYIFKSILNINSETDYARMLHIEGTSDISGILQMKKLVDSGEYRAAFGLYPISFNDLIKVANQGLKMPPKCTNIEPKLFSGLVMYDMK